MKFETLRTLADAEPRPLIYVSRPTEPRFLAGFVSRVYTDGSRQLADLWPYVGLNLEPAARQQNSGIFGSVVDTDFYEGLELNARGTFFTTGFLTHADRAIFTARKVASPEEARAATESVLRYLQFANNLVLSSPEEVAEVLRRRG